MNLATIIGLTLPSSFAADLLRHMTKSIKGIMATDASSFLRETNQRAIMIDLGMAEARKHGLDAECKCTSKMLTFFANTIFNNLSKKLNEEREALKEANAQKVRKLSGET